MSDHIEKCRYQDCGYDGAQVVRVLENGVHYAEVKCRQCGRNLRYLPKPDNDKTKYKRPTQHRDLVLAYSDGYCQMCLRKQADLPKGQTLEAQHVIEFKDGGSNDRENIWIVCTPCHRLVHWLRYYHGGDYEGLLDGMLKQVEHAPFG